MKVRRKAPVLCALIFICSLLNAQQTGKKLQNEFLSVYKAADRYYFHINDSLLDRDVLVVNRIAKAAAGQREKFLGYAGDAIGDQIIRFTKGPSNKIFLRTVAYTEIAGDTSVNGMYRSVRNSNIFPIVAAFDLKPLPTDSTRFVVDVTDYIKSDNEVFSFSQETKNTLRLGVIQQDKTYIDTIKSYPTNAEIRTVKTYAKMPMQSTPGILTNAGNATYELNSSLILLPVQTLQPRYADARVGYFSEELIDFDANPQGVKKTSMITRFRLEPRREDISKCISGEIVEPLHPIVFYIDPATPRKWIPYLIAGVNDWQVAFRQAGFKNAIIGREVPNNDSTWSIDDARHNVIVYKPSAVQNASGPHVHDPRSGEIIEAHVNWYHNVMELLKNWYTIQAAAVDPRARNIAFEDSLMGRLIRFVCAHEVGHSLGLRHNFGASSTVPVERLREKNWVEAYGPTPSIMDYARFNYVAQPEDSIGEAGMIPRIGEYDKWAIEWGYRWIPPQQSSQNAKVIASKWITDRTQRDKQLWFGTETDFADPRCQNEDLGDDAMKAGAYGIKNLKRILPQILSWRKESSEDYTKAKELYGQLLIQFQRYLQHVVKNIGGLMMTPKTTDEPGVVFEYTPKEKQEQAMKFLKQHVFITPTWIMDKEIFNKTGAGDISVISRIQQNVLDALLEDDKIRRLLNFDAKEGVNAFRVVDLIDNLHKAVWYELEGIGPIGQCRRALQKMYIAKLGTIVNPPLFVQPQPALSVRLSEESNFLLNSDWMSIVKQDLRSLRQSIIPALPRTADKVTQYHLRDCIERIEKILDPVRK